MQIQLHELTKVSNNSIVTNCVLHALNNKLDDKEKRDFMQWLKIVKNESEAKKRKIDLRNFT